ncbi:MAG TPA: UV DNA damage repair endonuclease UvsE [Armatimonadota bacterium]
MIHAIGYAGICLGLPERSISRTVRLRNATPDRLRELTHANLTDLLAILAYNVAQRFCLFRMNQAIIPLVSHPLNTLRWWEPEEFGNQLAEIGNFINAHGLRVSMHPGQYTVLNSTNPAVVESSRTELAATCRVLDALGLDEWHKIILHGGAGKPDKRAALERFRENWQALPANVRARLVLENDDTTFSVEELLPVCREMHIPLVFDRLHHLAVPGNWANRPIAEIMAEVACTWNTKDGRPKVHFSSQDPEKRPGAHAYWLNPREFLTFMDELQLIDVDLMAECKGKDLALLRLRAELGWDSLGCE